MATRMHRVAQRLEHLVDRLADERRGVVDDGVVEPVGEARLRAPPSSPGRARPSSRAFEPGSWKIDEADRRLAVERCRSGRSSGRRARRGPTSGGGRSRPSASVLRMMSANCSASTSRPRVLMRVLERLARRARAAGRSARPRPGRSARAMAVDHVAGRQVARPPASPGRARPACCSRCWPRTVTSPTPGSRASSSLSWIVA